MNLPALKSSPRTPSIPCRACGRENAAGRRFCGGCGQALWETCPQCNGEVAIGERFCGQCGLDIHNAQELRSQELARQLAAAAALAEEHRYEAALTALRSIADVSDPKYASWAAKARAEIERVQSRQQVAVATADAAKQQARQLVAGQAFEQARKLLDDIPPSLRDAEATELLEYAQFAGKELATLLAEIREAAQQCRTWELFPKIARVLALKPDHQAVLNLAQQLREKVVANARKRLADERYADAAQALLQIPQSLHTEEASRLLDQARELAALAADLEQSPYATPEALAVAQRFAGLVPKSEEVARLTRQLADRCATQDPKSPLARPRWAKPRERSALGPPIEWLGHFRRAQPANDRAAETLRNHPGEFFLALGLALGESGKGEFDIELLAAEKKGMLGKLASLPLLARRTRTSAAWGIDLGSYALKALKLSSDAAGNVKVEDAHYIPLSKPLAHPEAEGERPAIFAAALADLAGRVDLKGSSVAAALSGHQVLGRFFDLPPLPAKKVAAAVEYEARHQIPIDLTELCWGYCELRQIQAAADGPRPIMVLAARRSHAEECSNLFESVGIRLASLQGNCLALHNALRFELEPERPSTTAPVAIVDVGGDETNFIVSAPGSAWFRCFGAAGHSFTAALLAEFRLTYNDAEILKRHPAKARRYHRFREALAPPLAQFAGEIDRSLASFRRHSPMSDVARLYAVGGGANLHGLLRQCISGDAS